VATVEKRSACHYLLLRSVCCWPPHEALIFDPRGMEEPAMIQRIRIEDWAGLPVQPNAC